MKITFDFLRRGLQKSLDDAYSHNKKLQEKPTHMDFVVALGTALEKTQEFCELHDKSSKENIVALREHFNSSLLIPMDQMGAEDQKNHVSALMNKMKSEGAIKGISKDYTLNPKTSAKLETALKRIVAQYQKMNTDNTIKPKRQSPNS